MSTSSSSGFNDIPAPQCHCPCDCNEGQGGKTAKLPVGVVNLSNGAATTGTVDLSQSGGGAFNMGLGQGLEYSGDGSGSGGGIYGNYWVNSHQPALAFDGTDVLLESGPVETIRFIKTGSSYTAQYFVRDILTYDSGAERYTVTSPDGKKKVFSKAGRLESIKDAHGNEAICTYGGGELVSMEMGSGAEVVGYYYSFATLGRMESVVMQVGGSDFRRVSYFYSSSGDLEKVILEQMAASVWAEIDASYFYYHTTGSKKLRFVLSDQAYKQMHSVTPLPGVAQYADAEYSYYTDGRVQQVKTNGGKYTYNLSYAKSAHSGSTSNVWTSKTVVEMPDGSTRTFYFNRSLNLLLEKVSEPQSDDSTKEWYPVCQRFDGNTRIVLSASSAAVDAVDESWPTLFTLKPSTGVIEVSGVIEVFTYDAHGNKTSEGLLKGLPEDPSGSVVLQKEFTFEARTVSGLTIYVKKTMTVYQEATDSSASGPETTSFDYTWYSEKFQIHTLTTTLPAVPDTKNGDNLSGTTSVTYDQYGFVTEQVDAMGKKSTFEYYADKGAMKQNIEDAEGLVITTDYDVDPLGRTVRVLEPEHPISLGGVETVIRTAKWMQYLDTKDEVRTIEGYVIGETKSWINPVQISRNFVLDPGATGGRMEESIAAEYSGTEFPSPTTEFEQSSYVRWSTQHYDSHNEQTHSRLYHKIPDSGLGENGENYAQTGYGYDNAGRQNTTISPEGTISLVEYNAMSWAMSSHTGTTNENLVIRSINEYDSGAGGGNGNLTMTTNFVDEDGSPPNVRITLFRNDWRDRQVESEANDGTRTLITLRTYDNWGNVTQVDDYQNSIASENLINCAKSFFDGRNRQYRTERYGVTVETGAAHGALTSEVYYDQAGRTVRSTPAGIVGFNVMHYDGAGRTSKQFHAFGGTLSYTNPGDIDDAKVIEQVEFAYDSAGNALSTTSRQRFDGETGEGELGDPTSTTQPKARVTYVASYPDALGRTVATANFGTNPDGTWTRPATIPAGTNDVLVSSVTFNSAGEQTESIDPMGTVTKQEFDKAGRLKMRIENFQP